MKTIIYKMISGKFASLSYKKSERSNQLIFSILLVGMLVFFNACKDDEDLNDCIPAPQADCICTEEYDPVCGCDGQTYSNACDAECNGIFDYTSGPCD